MVKFMKLLEICQGFDGCHLSEATQRSDSDGAAASIYGVPGVGAPVCLGGGFNGSFYMGPMTEHVDPYYVHANGVRGGLAAAFN